MAFLMGDCGFNIAGREFSDLDGSHCGRSNLIDVDTALRGLSD